MRTESDLVEDITVLRKLNQQCAIDLTCNLILDENYWSIESLIKSDSSEVQIIGLWGMGGIGKTTLATAMFQRVSFKYEGSCFLEKVSEVSKSHGINYTCNKLLSKLLKEDLDIDTPNVIPSMIRRRLKSMKSFIVLDDVHNLELLQNLIGVGHGWLGPGSTVIVTTRDKHVLISGGIDKIHQNLPKLVKIDLSGSKKLIECPNVSGSPNLKHVTLDGCESMPEVDSSIFHLQKLKKLNVNRCISLKSLSSNTCSPALRHLSAMDCINLKEFSVPLSSVHMILYLTEWDGNELPSSILHTKNLKGFSFPLSDCLVNLPENFCKYICLHSQQNREDDPFITLDKVLSSPAFMCVKALTFHVIPCLSEIPDSISLLSSLETFRLIFMDIRSLPETIKYLPRLKHVDIRNCKLLQSIPALHRFIPKLDVMDCESLEKVLSSMIEPYDNPIPGFTVLLNCKKLDPHSYQTVLKDAIDGIELRARPNSEIEDAISWNLLPAMPGKENWFHYSSTQVYVTLELPSKLLGFAYYMVLSQGHMGYDVGFGCECYLDNSSGERICITSFRRDNILQIHMKSDHLLVWYDPRSCKQIMDAVEQTKAISDVNSTSYNPKLTFTFFIDEALYDEVEIKECGFRWIYQEEIVSSIISESHDEEEIFQSNDPEEIVSPTNFESDALEDTVPPRKKLKLDNVAPLGGESYSVNDQGQVASNAEIKGTRKSCRVRKPNRIYE